MINEVISKSELKCLQEFCLAVGISYNFWDVSMTCHFDLFKALEESDSKLV